MPEEIPDQNLPSPAAAVRATAASHFDLETALTGAARIMRDVMMRQLNDNPEAAQETFRRSTEGDPVLDVLENVVKGIKHGTDISSHEEQIEKLVLNQEQRAELIDNILLTHDYDRLVKYIKARKVLEDFMLLCAERGDLSVTEALAFMKIVHDESETLQGRVKAGATSIKDVVSMLHKVDYAIQANEKGLQKKFDKTTPQGREIIRRLAHKLQKATHGKVKKESIPD